MRGCAGIAGVLLAMIWTLVASPGRAEQVNPYPPALITGGKLHSWTFDKDSAGWSAWNDCELSAAAGVLRINCTGDDPYLGVKVKLEGLGLMVKLRLKCASGGDGQIFWISDRHPGWAEKQSRHFPLIHDGEWHEYSVFLEIDGTVTSLRLDPGSQSGQVQAAWIEVYQARRHPLVIERVQALPSKVALGLRNTSDRAIEFSLAGQSAVIEGGKTVALEQALTGRQPFETCTVAIEPKAKAGDMPLPAVRRSVVVFRPEAKGDWVELKNASLAMQVARDGSGAKIERDGKLAAVLAPLVLADGNIPNLKLSKQSPDALEFTGEGIAVRLALRGDQIDASIQSDRDVEGPVLRAIGGLELGLFAGLEYLGKGESSSSKLDVETEDSLRFIPDRLKVTMPLMSCRTDRAAVALTWKDMTLQPAFASPNFVDGGDDHRMSLWGRKIEATILVAPMSLEETIVWAVQKMGGLPPLPKAPRDRQGQSDLAMKAINGPIAGEGGWGHCAEKSWVRQPYADIASTIWRLTGKAPTLDRLRPGGAHVRNDAIYFVTGRAEEWLAHKREEIKGNLAAQQEDGSFRYKGTYQRGHHEDTASGFCAQRAMVLVEGAHLTGDKAALDGAVKALDYIKRFDVPRGAQTWELSLHTPDILASAYLVWAYTRGYELTGRKDYLDQARRWAISGVPFVYLWGERPTMVYSTIAVYGATSWRAPLWIGLPVQWCGGVYAYALTLLAKHDKTLDWDRLARGILIAGQQMQPPDGPMVGCLPDSFGLSDQRRNGPFINPSALVSLQLALDGEVDGLDVAADGRHRVVAPFRVSIRDGKAHIQGKAGLTYQALVDGKAVEIKSVGQDVLELK